MAGIPRPPSRPRRCLRSRRPLRKPGGWAIRCPVAFRMGLHKCSRCMPVPRLRRPVPSTGCGTGKNQSRGRLVGSTSCVLTGRADSVSSKSTTSFPRGSVGRRLNWCCRFRGACNGGMCWRIPATVVRAIVSAPRPTWCIFRSRGFPERTRPFRSRNCPGSGSRDVIFCRHIFDRQFRLIRGS